MEGALSAFERSYFCFFDRSVFRNFRGLRPSQQLVIREASAPLARGLCGGRPYREADLTENQRPRHPSTARRRWVSSVADLPLARDKSPNRVQVDYTLVTRVDPVDDVLGSGTGSAKWAY